MRAFHPLLMASALFLAFPATVEAQMNPTPMTPISGTRLEVQARGESRVVPDIAIISTGVVTQSTDAATAMRDNAAKMARMIAALKKAGVADKDVQTQAISLSPQYRYRDNEAPLITGYQASNMLSVQFRDIGKSGAILDVLVKEGANQINGPTLSVEKPETALDEARVKALKMLQARAALYAKAAGMKVKRIITLSETSDYSAPMPVMVRAEMSMDASAKSSISPGEQSLGVTLSAVFELE
jgi:uncharacterized protein